MFPQAFKKTRRLLFTVNQLAGFESEITVICLERIIILSCIYFISIVLEIQRFTIKIKHRTVWLVVTESVTRLVGWFSWLSESLFNVQLLCRALKTSARKYMSQKTISFWAMVFLIGSDILLLTLEPKGQTQLWKRYSPITSLPTFPSKGYC